MKHLHAAALALALIAAPAFAQPQKGPITVKSVAEVEVDVKNAKGEIEKKRAPATLAVPGSQVIYTTTFTNESNKPAGNVAVTNPIPPNTRLVDGSTFGDNTAISYSVDGGKSYDAPDKLKIKTADGKERAALAADYTHIRWVYNGSLAPEKTGSAGFRVVIK
jgi:uncharacterized repeat protein (TIGR01451 family)